MVSTLICSGQLSLPAWEAFVPCQATQVQSVERRWRRFLGNERVRVSRMYVPLVNTSALHARVRYLSEVLLQEQLQRFSINKRRHGPVEQNSSSYTLFCLVLDAFTLFLLRPSNFSFMIISWRNQHLTFKLNAVRPFGDFFTSRRCFL